jgi:hypothetical protein
LDLLKLVPLFGPPQKLAPPPYHTMLACPPSLYGQFLCLCINVLWVWLPCPTLCDKVCQWLAASRWFSPCLLVSSTNKTDRQEITKILVKVVFNTIKQKQTKHCLILSASSSFRNMWIVFSHCSCFIYLKLSI